MQQHNCITQIYGKRVQEIITYTVSAQGLTALGIFLFLGGKQNEKRL